MKTNIEKLDVKHIIKKIIYSLYKKVQFSSIIVNLINYLYNRVIPHFKVSFRPCKYNPQKINFFIKDYSIKKNINNIKIAFICDEMTYRCFSDECETVFLTPHNWLPTIIRFQPDILFCESAWSGINEFEDCWRGKIYKNNKLKFENRRELFKILDYCKRATIKTVFWNKEDPVFFNHEVYNFTDTALHFDYIFTTAKECIEKYKSLGHKNVNILMFGFSPKLYNPIGSSAKDNLAVFAGSWYADQVKRCEDMNEILNMILDEDIAFKIYNRHYKSANPINRFPVVYEPYLKEGINFIKLSSVIKKARYAVNVNTVTDSETMFARRVFELMACNTCVISNYSLGMEKLFGENVWFIGEKFDKSLIEEKCKQNIDIVFKYHTYDQRLKKIMKVMEVPYSNLQKKVKIIYEIKDMDNIYKYMKHFEMLDIQDKEGYILNENKLCSLYNEHVIDIESFRDENELGYFIIVNLDTLSDFNIENAIPHFSYIDDNIGIKKGKLVYEFIYDTVNTNTLFCAKMMKCVFENMNIQIKKYII